MKIDCRVVGHFLMSIFAAYAMREGWLHQNLFVLAVSWFVMLASIRAGLNRWYRIN